MKLCFPLINTMKITNCIKFIVDVEISSFTRGVFIFCQLIHILCFKVGVLIEITRYWSTWLVSLSIKTSIKEILCGMTKIEILCGIQFSSWNIFPLPRSLCSDMFEFLLETPRILHSGISVYCWNFKYSSPTEKYAQGKRHHWCYSNCLLILGLLLWLIWKEDLNIDLKYTKVTHICNKLKNMIFSKQQYKERIWLFHDVSNRSRAWRVSKISNFMEIFWRVMPNDNIFGAPSKDLSED